MTGRGETLKGGTLPKRLLLWIVRSCLKTTSRSSRNEFPFRRSLLLTWQSRKCEISLIPLKEKTLNQPFHVSCLWNCPSPARSYFHFTHSKGWLEAVCVVCRTPTDVLDGDCCKWRVAFFVYSFRCSVETPILRSVLVSVPRVPKGRGLETKYVNTQIQTFRSQFTHS